VLAVRVRPVAVAGTASPGASGAPSAPMRYFSILRCSAKRLMPRLSAARLLLPAASESARRISPRSSASTRPVSPSRATSSDGIAIERRMRSETRSSVMGSSAKVISMRISFSSSRTLPGQW